MENYKETIENYEEAILELVDNIAYSLQVNKDKRRIKIKDKQFTSYTKYNNPLNTHYSKKLPSFRLSKNEFEHWIGPIVYICWEFEEVKKVVIYKIASYIGRSNQGLSRPLGKDHHMKEIVRKCDELEILPCESIDYSIELEKILIRFLRPIHNKSNSVSYPPLKISTEIMIPKF